MMLIPRFYYSIDLSKVDNLEILKEKENTSYITTNNSNIKRMYVFKNNTSNGKFLKIDNSYYFKPKKDLYSNRLTKYICSKCKGTDERIQFIFKTNIENIDKFYNHPDLYYLFYDFNSFETWYYNNKIEIFQLLNESTKVNINYCEKMIINHIKEHFESISGNIFLLKIKFDETDMTDFIFK